MMRTSRPVSALAICLGILLAAAGAGAAGGAGGGEGGKAPSFSGATLGADNVSLGRLLGEGRTVLVNFWGLRCGACIAEIPHLNAIHEEFSGKGLVTLGVNVDGADPELLRELLAERPVKPAFTVVCDPEFAIAEAFGLKGAPLTVLIDREGIIRYRHENFSPGDEVELRAKVRDALPSGDAGK